MRSKNHYAIYYETEMEERLIIGVYADDMIITGSNSHNIIKFKEAINKFLEMTDLGYTKFLFGN